MIEEESSERHDRGRVERLVEDSPEFGFVFCPAVEATLVIRKLCPTDKSEDDQLSVEESSTAPEANQHEHHYIGALDISSRNMVRCLQDQRSSW